MPDDNRIDLGIDLDAMSKDIVENVKAATDEVKQRRAADKEKAARETQRGKSRRMSAIAIAAGSVIVLLLSYWMVFARPEGGSSPSPVGPRTQAPSVKVNSPCVTPSAPVTRTAPSSPTASSPAGRGSQLVTHPPDRYEQPSKSPGM